MELDIGRSEGQKEKQSVFLLTLTNKIISINGVLSVNMHMMGMFLLTRSIAVIPVYGA